MEITRGQVVTVTEYKYEFTDEHGNGYSFPCDQDGNVNLNYEDGSPNPYAQENYNWCKEHEDQFDYVGIRKLRQSYREQDTGVCDNCGKTIEMYDEYYGACECEYCGQWYNLFGQRLLPPDQWEE